MSQQQNTSGTGVPPRSRLDRRVAWLVMACVLLVAVWEGLTINARRAHPPFTITSADFAEFTPAVQGWSAGQLPVGNDPLEPNVLVYRFVAPSVPPAVVQSRLAHGFNMRDCMRLKGYDVHLLEDTRREDGAYDEHNGRNPPANRTLPVQVWLLEAPTGDLSIWFSTVLRAGDMGPTHRDMRSIPFPRIGMPMGADWVPEGLRWSSLRHPVRNFRRFLQAKWNNARSDPLVFLGIKRPPWADPSSFTYLTVAPLLPGEDDYKTAVDRAQAMHAMFHKQLHEWWNK